MGTKGHNIVYGVEKERETQLLASILNLRTSHEVTKIVLCRQGGKVTKGCPSETHVCL